jgi:hypothetical protein
MKNTIIALVVGLLLGGGLGTFLFPQVKTKEVQVEKEVVVKDIVTVTKVITRPDGTKEELITVTDKTKENKQTTSTKTVAKANWHTSISAKSKLSPVQVDIYTIQVEKRILGDLFLGAVVSSDKTVGLSIGLEF